MCYRKLDFTSKPAHEVNNIRLNSEPKDLCWKAGTDGYETERTWMVVLVPVPCFGNITNVKYCVSF